MNNYPLHQLDPPAGDSGNKKKGRLRGFFADPKAKIQNIKGSQSRSQHPPGALMTLATNLPLGLKSQSQEPPETPLAASRVPSVHEGYSQPAFAVSQHLSTPSRNDQPTSFVAVQSKNLLLAPQGSQLPINIFAKNVPKPMFKTELPRLGQRIEKTEQLVYCNTLLLQDPLSPHTVDQGVSLDKDERKWLDEINNDQVEKEHMRSLVTRIVEEFVSDPYKDSNKIAEVAALGPVLQRDPYRSLISTFINEVEGAGILDADILQGLGQLLQSTSTGFLNPDDLIKILSKIRTQLEITHQQSTDHCYHLALAVSRILDVMADHKVEGLNRVLQEEPLSAVLSKLKTTSDPYLIYQACYAFQALLYVPSNETPLQSVLRHTVAVATGLLKISAVMTLDILAVLEGLGILQETALKSVVIIGSMKETISSARKAGRGLLDSLKEGFGSGKREAWYPAIKAAYAFAGAGQLEDLRLLILKAPCRHNPLFQWGICQLLGEIALDTIWSATTRQQSVSLLEHLYRNESDWGQDEGVKEWMFTIFTKLGSTSDQAVNQAARALLQDLEQGQTTSVLHPYLLRARLSIPDCSPLLTKIQNVFHLERDLHNLRRERLGADKLSVYIPPMAKADLKAGGDNLSPLMNKVQEFLDSTRQVMLILGDSGAGKSAFNRYLERKLWTEYRENGRIPLFISLPAIPNPEVDMVDKQLRVHHFKDEQIKEMKQHRKFILICDGYDESQRVDNLHKTNRLNENTQLIISCRSQFLGSNYANRFVPQPSDSYQAARADLFQEAVIAPFSKKQIEDYVTQYVSHEPGLWGTEDYMRMLTGIPNLMDLVKNPFLLTLTLKALPDVTNGQLDLSVIKITSVRLYDHFVDQWIGVNERRLQNSSLSDKDRDTLNQLIDAGFSAKSIAYSTKLATAIFDKEGGNPVVQYVDYHHKSTWKAEFFGSDPEIQLLLKSSPMTSSKHEYRYVHRSILEYFLSCAVFDPRFQDKVAESFAKQIPDFSAPAMSAVQPSVSQDPHSMPPDSLISQPLAFMSSSIRSLLSTPSVCQKRLFESSAAAAQMLVAQRESMERLVTESVPVQMLNAQRESMEKFVTESAPVQMLNAQRESMEKLVTESVPVQMLNAQRRSMERLVAESTPAQLLVADTSALQKRVFESTHIQELVAESAPLRELAMKSTALKKFVSGSSTITNLVFEPTMSMRLGDASSESPDPVPDPPGCPKSSPYSSVPPELEGADPLYRFNLLREPSVIVFLSERVKHHPNFKEGLLHIIRQSKDNHLLSIAATNAITILVRAGVRFNGEDLRGIRVPGADLSDGQFDSAQLQGADLRGVNLARAWLRLANFGEALVDCVRFGELPYLEGKPGVDSFAYSPNGKVLAVGLKNGYVGMYDTTTWKKILWTGRCKGDVMKMAFSPFKHHIVSTSSDNTVLLWDIASGKNVRTMRGHNKPVNSVAFSPSGNQIASGSSDNTIRLWNAQSGEEEFVLKGHGGSVNVVKYIQSGLSLVSGGQDGAIRFWDSKTGKAEIVLESPFGPVRCLDYSPDGRKVASGHLKGQVQLWNAQTGDLGITICNSQRAIECLVFSPDSQRIILSGEDCIIQLVDCSTGSLVSSFSGHSTSVLSCAFSPDGMQLASRDEGGIVRLWDANSRTSTLDSHGLAHGVSTVAYSPDGQLIYSLSYGQDVQRWSSETGSSGPIGIKLAERASSFALSSSGPQVATGGLDGSIQIWNGETGTGGRTLVGHTGGVDLLVYSPCGRWIVSTSSDRSVRLWDLHKTNDQGVVLHVSISKDFSSSVQRVSVAFSPVGHQFAVSTSNRHVLLFNPQSDTPYRPTMTTSFPYPITSLAYSPNGQNLVLGSEFSSIYVWDLRSKEPNAELKGHTDVVHSVAFSPCGKWLLSGEKDSTIRLWQPQPGKDDNWICAAVIEGCSESIECLAWNPEGSLMEFVSGSADGSVRVWKISTRTDGGVESVSMVWGNNVGRLCTSGLTFEGAIGLSRLSYTLLVQRGAVNSGWSSKGDKEKSSDDGCVIQ
ncbi:WD40-repeat-containing domain protein [Linnemannia elongata]|nr:WD40-repeat-containing domain protein [Linnemannia elongata]